MNIRTATIKDLEAVTSVEAECFPPAEAATREELAERLKYYANSSLVAASAGGSSNKRRISRTIKILC